MPTSLESEVTIGKFAKRTRYIVGCINHWSLSRCDPSQLPQCLMTVKLLLYIKNVFWDTF